MPEKKNYLEAVKCMFNKPALSDPSWAAGARTRYDDFAAIHINQTLVIHGTGNFLTYHRYLTWAYEKTLREECGYKGAQPFWNWFKYQDDVSKNPIFDGSELSLGGQGAFVQHNGTLAAGLVWIPSDKGGGCIDGGGLGKGPFQVNLGPIRPAMDGMTAPVKDANVYNPRCLRRDLNHHAATRWHRYKNLLNITVGESSHSIVRFQDELQGRPQDLFLGLHSGGHHVIGGDNSDNYGSIVDPAFFLHHAMVDYVYWLWQALNPDLAMDVGGTKAARSDKDGYTQKTDPLIMGAAAPNLPIEDILETTSGKPQCYVYDY